MAIKQFFAEILIDIYRNIFARAECYRFNLALYKLALRGMGVLNSDTAQSTGEIEFLNNLRRSLYSTRKQIEVIFDVGANDHAYGIEDFPDASVYAFEPHPKSFQRLQESSPANVEVINAAVGDQDGPVDFWDFADVAPRKSEQPTSQLASVHKEIIEDLYHQPAKKYSVRMVALDTFAKDEGIRHIDILKIDAEGSELAVLQGAERLLKEKRIDIIQFEFNETHAYAGVLMKDFVDILKEYELFRLLPEQMLPLGTYRPLTHELFGFQNIVAIRKDLNIQLENASTHRSFKLTE